MVYAQMVLNKFPEIKPTQAQAVYDCLLAANCFLLVWVIFLMGLSHIANWPHLNQIRSSQIALFVAFGALWAWKWLLHALKQREEHRRLMWKILIQDRFDN